ncbi:MULTISPECIES: phage portal protein [Gammaproteobacteria]|uniref:phage portal protein n=1 Tax=Gammaproteobacteria TaxID=1236 RepID=UPI002FCC938D
MTQSKVVKTDGYNDIFKNGESSSAGIVAASFVDLSTFYIDDPIARKIIDVIPEEMVMPGFGVDGIGDDKVFKSRWDELDLNERIVSAMCWSRLYGGSAMVALFNDRRALTSMAVDGSPLESIRVYEKDQIRVKSREKNPRNIRYGLPVIYTINPRKDGMPEYDVHFSRVYVLDGDRIPESIREMNEGWGASVLCKELIEAIIDYNYCERLATQLLRRKQQAVWKAKGLADMCDDDEGHYAARIRLAQVDDNSGVGRAVGIDAELEEYDVLNSDISGVGEFLDKKMDRIVNYSGIHEIVIKNKNVGGVSASQNTALETFYKMIDRNRNEVYRPILEWLLPHMIDDSKDWSVKFEPLSVPSKKEESETLKANVESVSKMINDQVIDVGEARDTLEAMSDVFKLKGSAPKLPPPTKEE